MTWVVIGLGNPGECYAATRHNIGWMVVDAIADRHGVRFRKARFNAADVAEVNVDGERILLAKSRRYMNDCGPSLASVAAKAKVPVERVIVVHDDIDLPFGAMRVKQGGGTAGHNGLKSLQRGLGSAEFPRVRLGVGRPSGRQDPADYVLEPFSKRERDEAAMLVTEGADAVESLITDGLQATQDRFNRSAPP